MVAKLVLDEISSSGSGITIDSSKTLTVNGSLISSGSTNIMHKTIDHLIVEADVSGKSELIITTAPGAPRDITLPLVSVTGADTCIITIIVSADSTGTDSVRAMDGGSEAWTGYQKGDFVKFCISDGAWFVVDHKETYFSHRYLTADQDIAATAGAKLTGFTNVSNIGAFWDNTDNKLVTPFAGFCDIRFALSNYVSPTDSTHSLVPQLYVDGAAQWLPASTGGDAVGYHKGTFTYSLRLKLAASKDVEFYAHNLQSGTIYGGTARSGATRTQFTCSFERTY